MSTSVEPGSEMQPPESETSPESVPQAHDAETPDPLKSMKALAMAGDLAGLLDAFITFPRTAAGIRQIRPLLRSSVKQASKQSPRRFTREVYREATAFLAYVQMRLHTYAVLALADVDRQSQPRLEPLSDELTTKILPQIEQLLRLTMELSQSWAQTCRLWRLTRRGTGNANGRRRPRDFNEWYDGLVEDGVLPELHTS
jgi:hypothetical protein